MCRNGAMLRSAATGGNLESSGVGLYICNSPGHPSAPTLSHAQTITAELKWSQSHCRESALLMHLKRAEGALPCSKFGLCLVSIGGWGGGHQWKSVYSERPSAEYMATYRPTWSFLFLYFLKAKWWYKEKFRLVKSNLKLKESYLHTHKHAHIPRYIFDI